MPMSNGLQKPPGGRRRMPLLPRSGLLPKSPTMQGPPPFRKRAAIFDLDGTLMDSMPLVVDAFIHAVEPFRPRPTEEEVLSHLGGPLQTCIRNILGQAADAHLAAAWDRLLKYEQGKEEKMRPFPGARELLASLQARGAVLGIWTGRDRWSAERVLEVHGLGGFFGATVCGDDLATHKPDPEGLLRVIALLRAAPEEVAFLGDADVDVLGGHAAGVHTIFVHHGRVVPAHIHAHAAEVFANTAGAYAAMLGHFA